MPLDLKGFAPLSSDLHHTDTRLYFPVAEMPLGALDENGGVVSRATRHKAIVRQDDQTMVGIVGRRYRVLPNDHFFSTIERALDQTVPVEMREGVCIREQTSGGGSWSKREWVFPAYAEMLRNTQFETQVGLRIIAWNSYDGCTSAGLLTGLIDFYCTNGMITGRSIERELRRHSTRLTPELFVPALRDSISTIHESTEELQRMMNTRLDADAALRLLEASFSASRAAEIYRRMEAEIAVRGSCVFALHSALTFYASHNTDQFSTRPANTQDGVPAPDNESRMLQAREDEVTKIVRSRGWQQLMAA